LTASWRDVIHPDLQSRFLEKSFQPRSALRNRLDDKRLLNPALHAAISDGLNSFARYGVAPVITRLGGKLIYAGGDDVCAILPLDAALEAAGAIQRCYSMGFVRYGHEGAEELSTKATDGAGKMGMHLGKAPGISISGTIVIAHHKTPLREVLRDAHSVLDGVAKTTAGRNALAIRLQKRSGGDRDVWLKWNEINHFCTNCGNDTEGETLHTSFTKLMQGVTDDMLGASLLYRMADLEQAITPLAATEEQLMTNREKIIRLVQYEVGHSGKKMKKEQVRQFAERLAGLMVRNTSNKPGWYNPEAAIIAGFLAAAPATRRDA
jgi:CRISPR-associated protein Cmr2